MSESKTFIEIPDDPEYTGVYITASGVRDVLTSSHLHCTWEVSRNGCAEPCMKPAVAIRYDEQNGVLSEVCKHHAKRVLVPLEFIVKVAATIT